VVGTVFDVKSMTRRLLIKALSTHGCYKESERGIGPSLDASGWLKAAVAAAILFAVIRRVIRA
jgi:hypothetical protein